MAADQAQKFHRFVFIFEFDELAQLEARDRGYLSHVAVETANGTRYPVTFYDAVRLQQDLEESRAHGTPYIADVGMIVLNEVTIETMELACRDLCLGGFFMNLSPLNEEEIASAKDSSWPPPRRGRAGD